MEKENWEILTAEAVDGQKCIYTILKNAPVLAHGLNTLILIKWAYSELDEYSFPKGEDRRKIYEFDEQLDPLDEKGRILKVLTITGLGVREWAFYTDNFSYWINSFNKIMEGKNVFPIQIVYDEDSDFLYWQEYAQHIPDACPIIQAELTNAGP